MTETPDIPEPANLKLLRRLVVVLLVVMILGFVTIVALFVMRLGGGEPTLTQIKLPTGVTALNYTRGPDWYAIVGDDNVIRIFNLDQSLRQEIKIYPQ